MHRTVYNDRREHDSTLLVGITRPIDLSTHANCLTVMVGFLYVLGFTLVDRIEFGSTTLRFQEFRG